MTENKTTGKLYIVATPIGNLGDMSYRAIETLRSVSLIAAEDTRNSIKLLNHFEIKTPMTSYHEHNKYEKAEELIKRLRSGEDIAVITDAGTPCISDPGEVLARRCAEEGIEITGVPGACAAINALAISGLSSRHFLFVGFLPSKKQKKDRRAELERLRLETATMILYEAPHHLMETMHELCGVLGEDRRVCLCREMTKKHEEIIRTSLGEACLLSPRGEYVLIIEGASGKDIGHSVGGAAAEACMSVQKKAEEILEPAKLVEYYIQQGMDEKEAMKKTAIQLGIQKREVYRAWHGLDMR